MHLQFDVEQIEMLMRAFHTLTGIRFVLFDALFHEVISYPKADCTFCKLMKSNVKTRRKCQYADRRSFEKCTQNNALVLYQCHAGLVEAVMPLHENDKVIGYLMFGQITDRPDKANLIEKMPLWSETYGIDRNSLEDAIQKITCKPQEHIHAAAKIMEACASYTIYKELITPESNRILDAAQKYIDEHLSNALEIDALCEALDVGRTKLYELFRTEMKMGIAEYIRRRRMHCAKKLLKTTALSVPQVAESVGFSDYNYFSRTFKKTYGKSPKSYRR